MTNCIRWLSSIEFGVALILLWWFCVTGVIVCLLLTCPQFHPHGCWQENTEYQTTGAAVHLIGPVHLATIPAVSVLVYLFFVYVYLFIIAFYRTCPHLTFQQALLPGATLGKLTATVPFHIPLSAKSQTKTLFYFYSLSTYLCLQRARHWLLPMHAEWFLLFLKQREDFNVVTKATQFVQYHLQTLICLNIKGAHYFLNNSVFILIKGERKGGEFKGRKLVERTRQLVSVSE